MPLISIIVPVYNTAPFLKQCLDSLKNQTFNDIEIVLVDDGSTDGSSSICDEYAVNDSRFVVLHKKNEGLAAARNDGIKISQAEYLLFVDSDDWVELVLCECVYNLAIDKNADIVVFQYYRYWKENKQTKKEPFPIEGFLSREKILTTHWTYTSVVAWNKLYRRKLFSGIKYPVGHLCEDNAVTYKLVIKSSKIYCSNAYLYHHRNYRPESIMNNRSKRLYEDQFCYEFQRLDDLKQLNLCIGNEDVNLAFSYLLLFGRQGKISEKCTQIIEDTKNLPWRRRMLFFIYRLTPHLFNQLMILIGKRIMD